MENWRLKMSKAGFPINDLVRRRLQTSLTLVTLTLSVASTLFLLLFSTRLGLGIGATSNAGTLTLGLTSIFSQFTLFVGILIFVIGAVLTSFISFLMMAQRTRDFGLIKAAGCPNSLVAGYFLSELITVTLAGCFLGVALGFVMDYAVANWVFSAYLLPNFWFAPLVFVAFFVLSIVFGLQPLLKAAKISPVKALSPVDYYGLTSVGKHKAVSKSALTLRIATRSLVRRQSATIRIIFLLSIVFMLLTVSMAGGIIASQTTTSWVQKTVNPDAVVVAHSSLGNQYTMLLSKFSSSQNTGYFNYSDPNLAIPTTVTKQLAALPSVKLIDARLILSEHVTEISNFTVDADTGETYPVGDNRAADVIVLGVNPANISGSWFVNGRFLSANDDLQAIVGDSIAQTMYSPDVGKQIMYADPLVEGIAIQNSTFNIVGVCVDPLNNGFVSYVPIDSLMNTTGIDSPNMLIVELNNSTDRQAAIAQIKTAIQAVDPDMNVFPLEGIMTKNTNFLASTWQTIMLLPILTLASAALCLVGYMMLSADEQHQEFAVLRAIGTKPRITVYILAIQSLIVLFSSFALGTSLGTVTTLVILMKQPLVTSLTIAQIVLSLLAALAGMFLLSLYPAFRLAKTAILKIMA